MPVDEIKVDHLVNVELQQLGVQQIKPTSLKDDEETAVAQSDSQQKNKSIFEIYWQKILARYPPHEKDVFQIPIRHPYPESWVNLPFLIVGAFATITGLFFIVFNSSPDVKILPQSVGASVVLFFCAPNTALTQPKNAVVGQLIGAFCGIAARNMVPSNDLNWLSGSIAVTLTCIITYLTNTIYPPAGATALNASTLAVLPRWSGFFYLFVPALLMEIFMLIMCLLINNLSPHRHYPNYWL
ncbi:hypothetical protein MIR68_000662 [Amoeboaphelidium protococcarum]|nr:hypothetical protein MIR68_000662 [Amoeboaphelidium protococcarum]KAI3651330.1 hypothetical protein MP228_004811 [Amoeboaphelidium protococcarum]